MSHLPDAEDSGLALGAVMPSCLAYISEHNRSGKTGKATTLTMTGYHAGAVAISLLAVFYSENWHLLFTAGGIALTGEQDLLGERIARPPRPSLRVPMVPRAMPSPRLLWARSSLVRYLPARKPEARL